MVLISSSLKTYREARAFALEQVTELKNSHSRPGRKTQGSTNYMGQKEEDVDDFDPWANGQQDEGDQSGDWSEESLNAVIAALKGKGKGKPWGTKSKGKGKKGGCWECDGDH